jgi:hypothetical protein
MDENAPEESWQEINNQLDIEEVWSRVEDSLDRHVTKNLLLINYYQKNRRFINTFAIIAASILILVLSVPRFFNQHQKSSFSQIDKKQKIMSENAAPVKNDNNSRTMDQPKENSKNTGKEQHYVAAAFPGNHKYSDNPESIKKTGTRQISQLNTSDNKIISAKNSYNESVFMLQSQSSRKGFVTNGKEITENKLLAAAQSVDKKNKHHVLTIGIISGINNTWLLNYETINGLQPSSLTNTLPTYGTELGLAFGIMNNTLSGFRGEAYFHSETSQQYKEYINARYVTRKIDLHYLKFQVNYTKNISLFRPILNSHILAGMYFSYLNNGVETIGGNESSITREFTTFDYGLVTGYENAVMINNNLTLKPGFRISYSFHNIFKGNQLIPSDFNKTNPFSMGFFLGIDYKF